MAVYTPLDARALAELIAHYNVGKLVSAKGIAEGVSNSNWLIETRGGGRSDTAGAPQLFILTMYERRIDPDDLPFFLGLLDHLADEGCPVPRTIHDREGAMIREIDGKKIALIEYLPGISISRAPLPAEARSVGKALAHIHLAGQSFAMRREQSLGLANWQEVIAQCGDQALASIAPDLPATCARELAFLSAHWPQGLPQGIAHCDLFCDNVLMLGDEVSGLIDFYFAANDMLAYDLAVTHAAWSFNADGSVFHPEVSAALIEGYQSLRRLSEDERAALPILARAASMRFISSRADDWLNTPQGALVSRKDPLDFVRRLEFYIESGDQAFAAQ